MSTNFLPPLGWGRKIRPHPPPYLPSLSWDQKAACATCSVQPRPAGISEWRPCHRKGRGHGPAEPAYKAQPPAVSCSLGIPFRSHVSYVSAFVTASRRPNLYLPARVPATSHSDPLLSGNEYPTCPLRRLSESGCPSTPLYGPFPGWGFHDVLPRGGHPTAMRHASLRGCPIGGLLRGEDRPRPRRA